MRVDPIGLLGWDMAADAFRLVVSGDGICGISGLKESPTPAITPELVALEAPLSVFNHHKPAFDLVAPAYLARGHRACLSLKQLFDQYRPVWKFADLSEGLNDTGLRVHVMKSSRTARITLLGSDRPAPEKGPLRSVVLRHAYCPRFVHVQRKRAIAIRHNRDGCEDTKKQRTENCQSFD